jgi:hypothetical protein
LAKYYFEEALPDEPVVLRTSKRLGAHKIVLNPGQTVSYWNIRNQTNWNYPNGMESALRALASQILEPIRKQERADQYRAMKDRRRNNPLRLSRDALKLARALQGLDGSVQGAVFSSGKPKRILHPSVFALAKITDLSPLKFTDALSELHRAGVIGMRGASFRALVNLARFSERNRRSRDFWLHQLAEAAANETASRLVSPDRLRMATAAISVSNVGRKLVALHS